MGLILFLKALFGTKKLSNKLTAFILIDKKVQYYMNEELNENYEKKQYQESNIVLAIQVTKYLMGIDLDIVRQSAEPEYRHLHDEYRDKVEDEADELMESDPLINELVRRSLINKHILFSCQWGSRWIDSKDRLNIEKCIKIYDNEISDIYLSNDFKEYIKCANQYFARVDAPLELKLEMMF